MTTLPSAACPELSGLLLLSGNLCAALSPVAVCLSGFGFVICVYKQTFLMRSSDLGLLLLGASY